MVKTMPGKMTPDFNGRSGRVTFSYVIANPFPVIEFTRPQAERRENSLPPGPSESPIQEAEHKFGTSSILVDSRTLAVSVRECQFDGSPLGTQSNTGPE